MDIPQKQLRWYAVSSMMKFKKFIESCRKLFQFPTLGNHGSLNYSVLVYSQLGNPIFQTLHVSEFFRF